MEMGRGFVRPHDGASGHRGMQAVQWGVSGGLAPLAWMS
jgi:hypothetical protein